MPSANEVMQARRCCGRQRLTRRRDLSCTKRPRLHLLLCRRGYVGLLGFAESNQHGLAAFCAHEGHGGVGFGFEVPIGQHTVDLALERRWYSLDDFWEGFFHLQTEGGRGFR